MGLFFAFKHLYSSFEAIPFQPIFIRLFSSPSLLSNLSQAFTKRPQQNKVPELKRELQRRQLDPVGTRKELTARLLEHDQLNLQVEKEERPTNRFDTSMSWMF